jgi:hypothetical protein
MTDLVDTTSDAWPDPPAGKLDLPLLELFHQDKEGYVALTNKSPTWKNVTSLQIKDLRNMLPGYVDQLLNDSYMTVNSMQAPKGKHYRGNEMVRRIQACYSDIDFYKYDLSYEETYALLFAMVASEYVPWPSIVAKSGRGMYAFWCFEQPEQYDREQQDLYRRTQDRICDILSRLGADPGAKDSARVLRLPGSYHTKAQAHVRYTPTFDGDGELVTYTLTDLAEKVLDVHLPNEPKRLASPTPALRALPQPTVQPAGKPLPTGSLLGDNLPTGSVSPEKRAPTARYFDFVTIAEQRGGICEGYREKYLWRFAGCLQVMGYYGRELFNRVWKINEEACRPPLTKSEVHSACNKPNGWYITSAGPRNIRSDTIARELDVTATEAIRWKLTSIMPHGTKAKRRRNTKARTRSRTKKTAARRVALDKLIQPLIRRRHTTSLRLLAEHLEQSHRIRCSHETVRKDLAILGWKLDHQTSHFVALDSEK